MIHASAPGKILWIGGYSVLERPNVSLVTAVNARVHAYAARRGDDKVMLSMPQFGIEKEISELTDAEKKAAKFVLGAIRAVNSYVFGREKSALGFDLRTESDAAFSVNAGKSGLGSSAAVTVATVAALLSAYKVKNDKKLVHKLSQYAHATAQGKVGSGFDIAAACYGTIRYVRYTPSLIDLADTHGLAARIDADWDCEIENVEWPESFRIVVGNFRGQSASTTDMVKKVMQFKKENPDGYSMLIRKIDEENRRAIESITDPKKFAEHFNNGRLLTRDLGTASGTEIEPEKSTRLIGKLVAGGALCAKLPGAGGGDSVCAICVGEEAEGNAKKILKESGEIELLDLKVENQGYRLE